MVDDGDRFYAFFPDSNLAEVDGFTRELHFGRCLCRTGKGDVEFWAAVVKPGTILYELDGVTADVAKRAFNRVAHKLPIKVRLVRRRHV